MLNFGQVGFLPCTRASSWVAVNSSAGVLFGEDRATLYAKRLTEACLKYWVREVFIDGAAELLPNVNLKLPVDVLLDMVSTSMWRSKSNDSSCTKLNMSCLQQ